MAGVEPLLAGVPGERPLADWAADLDRRSLSYGSLWIHPADLFQICTSFSATSLAKRTTNVPALLALRRLPLMTAGKPLPRLRTPPVLAEPPS